MRMLQEGGSSIQETRAVLEMRGEDGQGAGCPQIDEAGATGEASSISHAESETEVADEVPEEVHS